MVHSVTRKKWLFIALAFILQANIAGAFSIPDKPRDYVHDDAEILTTDQETSLIKKLKGFDQDTSNQLVVATFPSLEGESLEYASIQIAKKWKMGQQSKDNGLLLLIIPKDRQLRIEVGHGLESVITDAYARRIIEEKIKPAFRAGNFYQGIDDAVDTLILASQGSYEKEPGRTLPLIVKVLILLFLLAFFVLSRLGGFRGGTYYGGGWGGGGWSSGGGGGGFSGGGGSFGGGGSSGRW